MITLRIDGTDVTVPEGATVLDAARRAGVFVPTLCHLEGRASHASCMVCAVRETGSGRLLPACATQAEPGMVVDTDGPDVREARRGILGLLLGEHAGECEGPCNQACPAGIDVARMVRLAAEGRWEDAYATLRNRCALPGTLGRVCSAPCEKACRRGALDRPLRVCALKRFLVAGPWAAPFYADAGAALPTGKRVAVIGAGPAGLSAADFLCRQGHACTVFDENPEAGGMLRYGTPGDRLPAAVLAEDLEGVRRVGVEFRPGERVGNAASLEALREAFDAVILAVGETCAHDPLTAGLEKTAVGLRVDGTSWATSREGVFAAGGAVKPSRHAARSLAQGRFAAAAVDRFLMGAGKAGYYTPFHGRLGRLSPAEIAQMSPGVPVSEAGAAEAGEGGGVQEFLTVEQATAEAGRCLSCGCRKADSCRLREYAGRYHASPRPLMGRRERMVEVVREHPGVVYEPGKCIRCGRCVRTAEQGGEPLGLAFLGRGTDLRVGVPFGESLDRGLTHTAAACAEACPTGALSRREGGGRRPGSLPAGPSAGETTDGRG